MSIMMFATFGTLASVPLACVGHTCMTKFNAMREAKQAARDAALLPPKTVREQTIAAMLAAMDEREFAQETAELERDLLAIEAEDFRRDLPKLIAQRTGRDAADFALPGNDDDVDSALAMLVQELAGPVTALDDGVDWTALEQELDEGFREAA